MLGLDWSELKLVFAVPWRADTIHVRKCSKKCWWESLLQPLVSTILLEAGLPTIRDQVSCDFVGASLENLQGWRFHSLSGDFFC